MPRTPYPDADITLTQAERFGPFTLPKPDREPIPGPTRLATVLDGAFFAEFDPRTGALITLGRLPGDDTP